MEERKQPSQKKVKKIKVRIKQVKRDQQKSDAEQCICAGASERCKKISFKDHHHHHHHHHHHLKTSDSDSDEANFVPKFCESNSDIENPGQYSNLTSQVNLKNQRKKASPTSDEPRNGTRSIMCGCPEMSNTGCQTMTDFPSMTKLHQQFLRPPSKAESAKQMEETFFKRTLKDEDSLTCVDETCSLTQDGQGKGLYRRGAQGQGLKGQGPQGEGENQSQNLGLGDLAHSHRPKHVVKTAFILGGIMFAMVSFIYLHYLYCEDNIIGYFFHCCN